MNKKRMNNQKIIYFSPHRVVSEAEVDDFTIYADDEPLIIEKAKVRLTESREDEDGPEVISTKTLFG